MKKLSILLLSLMVLSATIKAGNDKPIAFTELPQQSQQFIKKYFTNESIALVKMESELFDKSYDVIFTNGNKIEFDKNGEWKEVDCEYTQVPDDIIPIQIRNYMRKNYPNVKINKIEKESRGRYEVELTNGIDLKFDSKFNVIDIDN